FGDAADGENHGTGARRDMVLAHGVHHFVESADNDLLQPLVHFVTVPEEAFLILDPLEVADGNTACIGKDIWQDGDSAPRQYFVGMRGGWAIGGLGDDASLDGFSVIQGDYIF